MKSLIKKLQLRRVLSLLLTGIVLCVSTACNSGDAQGARPENPPVQLGGQNNPDKMGGDNNTQYKESPDPKAHSDTTDSDDQANLQLTNHGLIAADDSNYDSGLLYPGSEVDQGKTPITIKGEEEAEQIPAKRQRMVERSNPDEQILEKSWKAFKDASEFLVD
ncbi:MAG: hypothetical protein BRC34_15545 [Cyanobacteria bacterium QH_1_48_107]|nr:MAG: hypothetical protein BRC34_15545 [Cyanobacteria bacterium QH_1_48_107]